MFVFHVLEETPEQAKEDRGRYHIDPTEVAFSATIVELWASMAATGKPMTSTTSWDAFDEQSQAGLAIGPQDMMGIQMVTGLRAEKCGFWDDHFHDSQAQRRLGYTSPAPYAHHL